MTVVDVGHALVRTADGGRVRTADPALTTAAMAFADDPFVLIGDKALPFESVWSDIWDSVLEDSAPVTLLAPSTWPRARLDAVAETLRRRTSDVVVTQRSVAAAAAAGLSGRRCAVVEITPRLVGVTAISEAAEPHLVAVVGRTASDHDVAARVAARTAGHHRVVVDGSGEARALTAAIGRRLTASGESVRVVVVDGERVLLGSTPAVATTPPTTDGRRWFPGVAAATVTTAALTVALGGGTEAPSEQPVTVVVEGRVAVNVPALWPVDRVTEGAGSARLQVNSPRADGAALHITQSRVPDGETLAHTADTLRRAVAAEPPGVFVDFDPSESRVGRAVVSYREMRGEREIRWSVMVDGSLRISIGCQTTRGRADDIEQACDEAVRSAHAIPATR